MKIRLESLEHGNIISVYHLVSAGIFVIAPCMEEEQLLFYLGAENGLDVLQTPPESGGSSGGKLAVDHTLRGHTGDTHTFIGHVDLQGETEIR